MLGVVGPEPGEDVGSVAASVAGSSAAHGRWVEDLFAARYGELVGLAGLILAGAGAAGGAEDVVQDVFAALYRRADPLDDPAAAVGYLRRSVVNGARSRLRRREVERRPHLRVATGGPAVEDEVLADDDARAVAAAVAQLPLRQRECIACAYQLGLTHAEAAAALDISVGSVKTHLHRATRRLATLLEDRR